MSRIIAFHQDEFDDWVAALSCGHSQHMRHDPPWQNRAWVVKQSGREKQLGTIINCSQCKGTK